MRQAAARVCRGNRVRVSDGLSVSPLHPPPRIMSIETLPPLAQPIYARLVLAAVDALDDGESVTAAQWLAMRATALGEALASFRLPALPRPPQPPPSATLALVAWGTYFESRVMRKLAKAIDAEFAAIFANQLLNPSKVTQWKS